MMCKVINDQETHLIDLSYELNENTITWPGGSPFERLCSNYKETKKDFYATGQFTVNEHSGTHIDAPFHFNENGMTVDKLPLTLLIADAYVINIVDKVFGNSDHNYLLSVDDIHLFEQHIGAPIAPDSIVLIFTGWSQFYKDGVNKYLGFEGEYNPEDFKPKFPGISKEAAHIFVDRKVAGIGLDTPSVDNGLNSASPSNSFPTHRILNGNNVFAIENINSNIKHLPIKDFMVFALPLKVTGGTGCAARVFATISSTAYAVTQEKPLGIPKKLTRRHMI